MSIDEIVERVTHHQHIINVRIRQTNVCASHIMTNELHDSHVQLFDSRDDIEYEIDDDLYRSIIDDMYF